MIHLHVTYLIISCSAAVFVYCRYNGDAVIKVNVNGVSAGIQHISVSVHDYS